MSLHKKVASFVSLLALLTIIGAIGPAKRPTFQWQETHEPYLPPVRIMRLTNS